MTAKCHWAKIRYLSKEISDRQVRKMVGGLKKEEVKERIQY